MYLDLVKIFVPTALAFFLGFEAIKQGRGVQL